MQPALAHGATPLWVSTCALFISHLQLPVCGALSWPRSDSPKRPAPVGTWRFSIKALSWIIALLGLWEFGDITALFVPGFGSIPVYLWNHIIVGLVLVISGVWAARTNNPGTARTLSWIAVMAGSWLVIATFILRRPVLTIGSLNDIIVGVSVVVLGVWAALTSPRAGG